jgi:hypothetical protein
MSTEKYYINEMQQCVTQCKEAIAMLRKLQNVSDTYLLYVTNACDLLDADATQYSAENIEVLQDNKKDYTDIANSCAALRNEIQQVVTDYIDTCAELRHDTDALQNI